MAIEFHHGPEYVVECVDGWLGLRLNQLVEVVQGVGESDYV